MGTRSTRAVLMVHFISLACWLGGVASCIPLFGKADTGSFTQMQFAYTHAKAIALHVIGWGGIGVFLSGLVLAVFTSWGLFRHRWVTLKFFLMIALILFGMFFNEQKILGNITLLEQEKQLALTNPVFIHNHHLLKMGLWVSITGFMLVTALAVYKPWTRKKTAPPVVQIPATVQ